MSLPPKSPPDSDLIWKVLRKDPVYACPPWITVERQTIRLPDGRTVDDYHQILLPDYAVIYVETEDGRVIVERQYKHGVGEVTLTLPAGLIKPGEDALLGAQRELLEETGYEASEWRFLGKFVQNSNYGGSSAHIFAARGARKVAEPDSGDLEQMEILLMTREELFSALRRNEIKVSSFAATIALATHPSL